MDEHPVQSLMKTAMDGIKSIVDVDMAIGKPIKLEDGSTVIPVSRLSFGFVAAGGEFVCEGDPEPGQSDEVVEILPFSGGSGGGAIVHPIGFLVIDKDSVRLLAAGAHRTVDRLVDVLPDLLSSVTKLSRPDMAQNHNNPDGNK